MGCLLHLPNVCYNISMTRRQKIHASALSFLLITTVPWLAVLSRGHTPSPYALANLPFWERSLPSSVPLRARLLFPRPTPSAIQLHDDPAVRALLVSDENSLFVELEHPSRHTFPVDAQRPGTWMESSALLGQTDRRLSAKRDRIAARLMNAQWSDGYLGAPPRVNHPLERDVASHCRNLDGLLAYYRATHNPAAIYAAMMGGDWLENQNVGNPEVVRPLAWLYQATGETKYLSRALRAASQQDPDGITLCTLYEVTDQKRFLEAAKQRQTHESKNDALNAALLTLTGEPRYAAALQNAPTPSAEARAVTYTRAPGGIAVNLNTNSQATFGPVHLVQQVSSHGDISLSVKLAHPTVFALHLYVASAAPQQIVLNGTALTIPVQTGQYVLLQRRWKTNDVLLLEKKPTAASVPQSHTLEDQTKGSVKPQRS